MDAASPKGPKSRAAMGFGFVVVIVAAPFNVDFCVDF
jgi:hypothetical protein